MSSWGYSSGYPDYPYPGVAYVRYGTRILTELSPAQGFAEPLTLAEIKNYLKVPDRSPADSIEDDLILSLISGARAAAEEEQGDVELIQRQWDHYFDYWPAIPIELGSPLVSVDLVQYRDSKGNTFTLVEGVDYFVDTVKKPGIIAPMYNKTWPTFSPWPSSAILIRYTSGRNFNSVWWNGEDGEMVKNGMRLLISDWYNNRLPYDAPLKDYPLALRMCLAGDSTPRAR